MVSIINANSTGQILLAQQCSIHNIAVSNPDSAAPVYVKFYNKATAPTGSDTPVWRILVPAGGGAVQSFAKPLHFDAGCSVRSTGAVANADTTAPGADTIVNVD